MITEAFNQPGTFSWTVPIGISLITVEVWGAQGGIWGTPNSFGSGGGGYVKATVPVTVGETITVIVGDTGSQAAGGFGGMNGGAPGAQHNQGLGSRFGYGGGGSSEVRRGATRLVVAGGGGGMGGVRFSSPTYENLPPPLGGAGGNPANAGNQPNVGGGAAGGGATVSAGGSAGAQASGGGGTAATAGTGSVAGTGGAGTFGHAGGGGGGGYTGGGGGGGGGANATEAGSGGGGGGGSSGAGGNASVVQFLTGVKQGSGTVKISFNEAPPSIPTNITPAAGSVLNQDNPTLGARFTTSPGQGKARVQWQLASDAAFSQNVRTFTQPETLLTSGGTAGINVTYAIGSSASDQRLSQGTWYIRARTIDLNNVASGFSGVQSFSVQFPPTTLNHFPTGNIAIQHIAEGITLAWDFISIAANTAQSAYQVVVEQNNGALVIDTGKVTSSVEQSVAIIPTALKGTQLRWRVRVWDTDNVVGPYSDYHLFRTADVPTVVIAAMSTVTTANPTVSFTTTPAGTAPIAQRRLFITRDTDGAIVFDSGWR